MVKANLPSGIHRHLALRFVKAVVTLSCVATVLNASASPAVDSIRLVNHHSFAIRQPMELRGATLDAESAILQQAGSNLVFIADIPANGEKELQISAAKPKQSRLAASSARDGLELNWAGRNLGTFSWDIVVEPAKKRSDEAIVGTRADFAAKFQALPLSFRQTKTGAVFDTWSAHGVEAGLRLNLDVRIFHSGFVDIITQITNESAKTSDVYSAIVCQWQHAPLSDRVLSYDNRRTALGETASTHFREVDGRHWHIQHGVDWVRNELKRGPTVLWMNPFNPSFTARAEASPSGKTPARYTAASQTQLANEAQSVPGKFFAVTEIARPNIKSYRDRVRENVLPERGRGFQFETRLVIHDKKLSDDTAEQTFVGYTGYSQQHSRLSAYEVTFGVPSVRFGTAYFPFSTLGENFDTYKLPGMDREAFWPLAADTVNQWRLFADEIRRDLRLAKWMGFQSIRVHHLELLAPIEKKIRDEYLDFFFNELRGLQLKALVDVYASPQQIEELLQKYGDVIEGIEIENEILIWGIPVDRPAQWKEIYAAVKRTAPHVTVHLTGQNNTGLFNALTELEVPYDKIGLHAYVDSLDALPSARGWALAAANFGARVGKPPAITEWNWRQLTRMTPEARAKIYPQIIEGAIGTRSIPEFHQFQFQETMAPNPRVGRGNILRHYELINLSRHPKLEAFELEKIIQRYIAKDDPAGMLAVTYAQTELDQDGNGSAKITIKNLSSKRLNLTAAVESSPDLKTDISGAAEISLSPKQGKTLRVELSLQGKQPGFYHYFIRLEGEKGFLRYAAGEARFAGAPKFDLKRASEVQFLRGVAEETRFDWLKTAAVVYGVDAPVLEAETAIAIAQTLESATGRLIPFYQLNDLPAAVRKSGNLILVGTAQSHALIKPLKLPQAKSFVTRVPGDGGAEWLIVGGVDSETAEKAGMDLVIRYWLNAKDSACRRVGLVAKELPRGIDPTKLP